MQPHFLGILKIRLKTMLLVPVAMADIFGIFLTHFSGHRLFFWQILEIHNPSSAHTCTKQSPAILTSPLEFHWYPHWASLDWCVCFVITFPTFWYILPPHFSTTGTKQQSPNSSLAVRWHRRWWRITSLTSSAYDVERHCTVKVRYQMV